jgi:hypothetical protein
MDKAKITDGVMFAGVPIVIFTFGILALRYYPIFMLFYLMIGLYVLMIYDKNIFKRNKDGQSIPGYIFYIGFHTLSWPIMLGNRINDDYRFIHLKY